MNPSLPSRARFRTFPADEFTALRFVRARRSPKLGTALILLVLAGIVPVLAFSVFVLLRFAQAESAAAQAQVRERVRAISALVDREIENTTAVLQLLATSPQLQTGDLAGFHRRARAVLGVPGFGDAIVLFDATGQQIVNTRREFGEPLPRRTTRETLDRVFATGRPQVSNLYVAVPTNRLLLAVDVPVFREGKVVYSLSTPLTQRRIAALVAEQRLPPGWIAAIMDRNGTIAVRSVAPERFVGKPTNPTLLARMADSDGGWFPHVTREGLSVYTAFARSDITGWTVAIGMPRSAVEGPLRQSLVVIASGGGALLLAGTGLAWLLGRRITRPIRSLSAAALALGRGEPPRQPVVGMREIEDVGKALATAGALLRQRARERERAEEALRSEHERSVEILESIHDAFFAVDSDWRFTYVNRKAEQLWGRRRETLIGKVIWDEFPAAVDSESHIAIRRAAEQRRPVELEAVSPILHRWVDVHIYPSANGISVYFRDITERKQAQEQQQLLLDELNHRVKNTLATVQSIAMQTLHGSASPEAFCTSFSDRLQALSQAHNLLTRGNWNGVQLRDIVLEKLAPYRDEDGSRVTVEGEDVYLKPNASVALGLVLHELATNAAKYGALSVSGGRVAVSWRVRKALEGRRLDLCWTETGGPTVAPPTRKGFGSTLIERGPAYQLDAEVGLAFDPEGVRCTITFPLTPEVENR